MSTPAQPQLGLGACSLGNTPCGYGSPGTFAIRSTKNLVNADGTQGSSLFIDPNTLDYVADADGNLVGSNTASSMMYLAIKTVKGTCIDPQLGIDTSKIQVLSDNTLPRIRDAINQAVSALVKASIVEIIDVSLLRTGPSSVFIQVTWRDIENDQIHYEAI